MAPIRRYLRISKYSVLECRIFLETPSDARWLLDSTGTARDDNPPVLTRIFNTIKPLVLPKLREENERVLSKKAKKRNPVKDVLVEDDFEVSIFLRESGTRHSLLTKQKSFGNRPGIKSNSNKMMNATAEILVESEDDGDTNDAGRVRDIRDIPQVSDSEDQNTSDNLIHADSSDDKKLQLTTSYEGFSIWGWVLCLLVTRKGRKKGLSVGTSSASASASSGQALMEEWIGTQMQPVLNED